MIIPRELDVGGPTLTLLESLSRFIDHLRRAMMGRSRLETRGEIVSEGKAIRVGDLYTVLPIWPGAVLTRLDLAVR